LSGNPRKLCLPGVRLNDECNSTCKNHSKPIDLEEIAKVSRKGRRKHIIFISTNFIHHQKYYNKPFFLLLLLGVIKYHSIYHYVIDRFSKIHPFQKMFVVPQ